MHPGFAHWWHAQHHAHHHGPEDHAEAGGCGPSRRDFRRAFRERFYEAAGHDGGDFGAGAFGVRRPLRFLAHKLDLNEEQVAELARVLDDLKTERAQAAVDDRRTTSAFADAVAGETFDEAKVNAAAESRVKSAESLRTAVTKALARFHAILDAEQRAKLAYLLRTGVLSI